LIADAALERPNHHSAGAWLEPYPGNSRAVMRPWRGSFVLSAMELCFQSNGCGGPSAKTLSSAQLLLGIRATFTRFSHDEPGPQIKGDPLCSWP
jgi:hypothetical protein